MATNLDTMLTNTTVSVDGDAIVINDLSSNERAIFLIALAALELANKRCLSSGVESGFRVGRSKGPIANVVVRFGEG